jgi:hypothetical protein
LGPQTLSLSANASFPTLPVPLEVPRYSNPPASFNGVGLVAVAARRPFHYTASEGNQIANNVFCSLLAHTSYLLLDVPSECI